MGGVLARCYIHRDIRIEERSDLKMHSDGRQRKYDMGANYLFFFTHAHKIFNSDTLDGNFKNRNTECV